MIPILHSRGLVLHLVFLFCIHLNAQRIENEIILQLAPGVPISSLLSEPRQLSEAAISSHKCLSVSQNIHLVKLDSTIHGDAYLTKMLSRSGVLQAQFNHQLQRRARIPDDPRFGEQWHLEKIGAPEVWEDITGGTTFYGDTIVIGVLEFGLEVDHEDLSHLLWANKGEIPNNDFDDDNNGYVDDYFGVSLDHGKDDHVAALDSHGTSVLSVMGATGNNGLGIAGVNWQVKVMLFTAKDVDFAKAIQAHDYFAEMRKKYNDSQGKEGAFVVAVNLSYGRDGMFESDNPIFCDQFNLMGAEGIISVGAAANSQGNADVFGDLPAQCSSDDLIIVTSTTSSDELAVAGHGRTTVDLAAPGDQILTATVNNGYAVSSGTSYATPQVAAAIALFHSHLSADFADFVRSEPMEAGRYLKKIILDNVDVVTDLETKVLTKGRLNMAKAYQVLKEAYPIQPTSIASLTTYPNPSFDYATISFDKILHDVTIDVFDVMGKRLDHRELNQSGLKVDLDVATLTPGTYFILLRSGNQKWQGRFVKY